MKFTTFTASLISILILAGCAVNPKPPQGKSFPPAPVATSSQIEVPLNVEYKFIEAELNKAVPQNIFFATGQPVECSPLKKCTWQLGVQRNGPITIVASPDGGLTVRIPVATYGGRVDAEFFLKEKQKIKKTKASETPEPEAGMHVDFKAEISVKPTVKASINPDWSLKSDVTLDFDVDVAQIIIRGVQISVRTKIREALNAQKYKIQEIVTKSVGSISFKSQAEQAWNSLNGAYKLIENPPVWLAVAPLAISVEQPRFSASNVTMGVGVETIFHTYAQATKPVPTISPPLPILKIVDKIRGSYQIALPVSVSVALANKVLSDLLGKEFVFSIGSKDFVAVLEGGRAYINGPDLVIYTKVKAKSAVIGLFPLTVGAYLDGTPIYEGNSRTIRMKPFDFDIDTNNLLLDKAAWMLHGKLQKTIQDLLVFEVGGKIDTAKNTLSNALKEMRLSDNLVLRGTVDNLSVKSVYTSEAYLNVEINAVGGISAALQQR